MVLAALAVLLVLGLRRAEAFSRGFAWKVLWDSLRNIRWAWLGLAGLCALATYFGRALRWAVLLKPVKPHPGIRNLFSATAIGFTAITLLGRPGEFVRPYLISVKEGVPFSSQLAAWLLERIYDLLMALAVFGFALSRVRQSGVVVGSALSWVLAIGGWFVGITAVVILAVLLGIRHFSVKVQNRLLEALQFLPEHRYGRAERLVKAFVQGVESTRSHHAVLLLTGYTILEWAIIAACTFCVMRAFGGLVRFSLVDVLIFLGFVTFGAVVQIPGVGGGIQVVSVLVLTELFRVPLEVATSMAILLWITTFVIIVPFGLVFALHEGLDWHNLRKLGREIAP
ncbi:MAG TPA: lysylphosphatidylglycerol synthase transmembrane domain-containing protein [Bryobacteraceae bacterium]|nr:lysylphosphatidylglycerol synthase transmembrane domain-containing protein [Bryobacteraceae bacterium]